MMFVELMVVPWLLLCVHAFVVSWVVVVGGVGVVLWCW